MTLETIRRQRGFCSGDLIVFKVGLRSFQQVSCLLVPDPRAPGVQGVGRWSCLSCSCCARAPRVAAAARCPQRCSAAGRLGRPGGRTQSSAAPRRLQTLGFPRLSLCRLSTDRARLPVVPQPPPRVAPELRSVPSPARLGWGTWCLFRLAPSGRSQLLAPASFFFSFPRCHAAPRRGDSARWERPRPSFTAPLSLCLIGPPALFLPVVLGAAPGNPSPGKSIPDTLKVWGRGWGGNDQRAARSRRLVKFNASLKSRVAPPQGSGDTGGGGGGEVDSWVPGFCNSRRADGAGRFRVRARLAVIFSPSGRG